MVFTEMQIPKLPHLRCQLNGFKYKTKINMQFI